MSVKPIKVEMWAGPCDGEKEEWFNLPERVVRQVPAGGRAWYTRQGPELPRRTEANRYVYGGMVDMVGS